MDANSSFPLVWFDDLASLHAKPDHVKHAIPIVFIHGAWGGKYQFERWMGFCAERGWESYALDLRGHHEGLSRSLGKISIQDYADDFEKVIERVGPCYVVGHSMGGLIAQVVASRCEKVKKAVFVASAPPAGIFFINAFVLNMLKYFPEAISQRPIILERKDIVRFLFNGADITFHRPLIPESSRVVLDILFQRIRIKGIRSPTLVVGGENDRVIPITAQKAIARKYHSLYIEIPHKGHMMMLEDGWQDPIGRILEWLEV